MLKELKNNNRGVVFVTVLIIIIVSMVLTVSVLSMNISQVKSAEDELKYIQAQVLADGGFARIFASQFSAAPLNGIPYSETLGNSTFTVTTNLYAPGTGPFGTAPVSIDVAF